MADYGKYLPPNDIEREWLAGVIQERERELRLLRSIMKRLNRPYEAEYRSA